MLKGTDFPVLVPLPQPVGGQGEGQGNWEPASSIGCDCSLSCCCREGCKDLQLTLGNGGCFRQGSWKERGCRELSEGESSACSVLWVWGGVSGAGTALEGPGEQPWPGAGPDVLQDHFLLLVPRLNFTWSCCCCGPKHRNPYSGSTCCCVGTQRL